MAVPAPVAVAVPPAEASAPSAGLNEKQDGTAGAADVALQAVSPDGPQLLSPTPPPGAGIASPSAVPTTESAAECVDAELPQIAAPTPEQIAASSAPKAAAESSRNDAALSVADEPKPPAPPAAEPPTTAAIPGAAMLGSLTGEKIEQHAKRQIAVGFDLARRGAYYAARLQFVDVLRNIAEAKDARSGMVRRAAALSRGLQALDEAEEFLQIPPDCDVPRETSVLLRSHKTPIGRDEDSAGLPPAQLAERYYDFAQRQMAAAVAGEPAGSMALHALGKLATQQHEAAQRDYPLALRRAVAFQHAALLARSDNYLAAHELGVVLAETGHYAESVDLLRQVAAEQPNPVVLRNLASVERSLGRPQAAALAEQEAARLAALTPDPRVAWVSPAQFESQPGDPLPSSRLAVPPAGSPYAAPQTARRAAPEPAGVPSALRFMR